MLISDFKSAVEKYNKDEMVLLAAELYKSIPKKVKEEKAIDSLIEDFRSNKQKGKSRKPSVPFPSLSDEIEEFIENAMAQNYFAPNRVIPKKDRPKWRFLVKGYIKDLQTIPVDSEDGSAATELLVSLYKTLQYGCGYYIFNTENPFASVGIKQTELLRITLTRFLQQKMTPETMKKAVLLAGSGGVDRDTLDNWLHEVLVECLKTTDRKELAISQCTDLLKEQNQILGGMVNDKKSPYDLSHRIYEKTKVISNLAECGFLIHASLFEYEEAIAFYKKYHPKEYQDEVFLYKLLYLLYDDNSIEYWKREYDLAVKKGVEPRSALQKTREYLQENGAFPRDEESGHLIIYM